MSRLLWLVASYVAGLGTALWLRRRVRRTVERCMPGRVRQQAAERSRAVVSRARQSARSKARTMAVCARRAVEDVKEAVAEGRSVMRSVESELSK